MKLNIKNGLYLVVDPTIPFNQLCQKIKQALDGGVEVVQIWNHWPERMVTAEKIALVKIIIRLVKKYDVPVIINEDWQLLHQSAASGIHFDQIPENFDHIKNTINRDVICGITCSNNLEVVQWANDHHLDYISFCSMFPSSSVHSCDIVDFETIHKAREISSLPIFLSGGITLDNIESLSALKFDGIALISGILSASSPQEQTIKYLEKLKSNKI